MTSKLDRIVALSVQLSAARARVTCLEAEIDRLVGGGTPLPKGDPRPGTLAADVIAWVEQAGHPVTRHEVIAALPRHSPRTIEMTLNRYTRAGRLTRPDRIAYASAGLSPEGR